MQIILALLAILMPVAAFAQSETTVPTKGLYAFETSVGMRTGAAFGVLPHVTEDDELLSVTSSISPRVEIHEMKEVNGIMQMRKVEAMPVQKDQDNKLAPTGYHLMIMDLKGPLKKGTDFPITLKFKKAGEKTLTVPVLDRKAK